MAKHKDIIICHQYYTPEHFKALYDCAEEFGYKIHKYIILSKRNIYGRAYRKIIKGHIIEGFKGLISEFRARSSLKFITGKNLIVGLAPYDPLLIKYKDVFLKNHSIYFSSFTGWNTEFFDRGDILFKSDFLKVLRLSFSGAACVSRQTESEIKHFFKKTTVVNHAIDVENYKKKDCKKRTKKYIFIGRVTEVKNVKLMCNWFIENRNSGATLTIVGNGDLFPYIEKCAKKTDAIIVAGQWGKKEIKENLRNYDFLLLPSEKEPFGIVLLEALASGVPCITSDASGPLEIINKDNGIIFALSDKINAFDHAMNRSLTLSDDEYQRMCQNAIDNSINYSSKYLIKKWLELLE